MLDQQLEVKDGFKMYGNMSSVEKALNKNDLRAYKNFDDRQFSLVPGIQHSKHLVSQSNDHASRSVESPRNIKIKVDSDRKFLEKQNHLMKIGYNEAGSNRGRNPITGNLLSPMQKYTKENAFPPGSISEMERKQILRAP
jgi:hypothetical protein